MIRNPLLVSILLVLSVRSLSYAQQQPPTALVHAAQCLVAKEFIILSQADAIHLGYLVDAKSYPGEKMMYVVNYTKPDRSAGTVFTILLGQRKRMQVLSINNNGRFAKTKRGLEFTDPPLGGVWTQGHIMSAIKEIEESPNYAIASKNSRALSPNLQCESFADRSRK